MTSSGSSKALFLIGAIIVVSTIDYSAWGQPSAIKIEATSKQVAAVELFAEESPVAGEITVICKIQNISQADLFLSVMSCSYWDDWKTDNIAIFPRTHGCKKNGTTPIKLKPGEIREVQIPLVMTADIPRGDIHFRLRYDAHQAIFDPKTIGRRTLLEGGPFWSNEVVFHTKLASDEKWKYWHAKAKWLEDFRKQDQMIPEKDGVYKRYSFEGELLDKHTFKDGKLNGPYKQYYPNGQVQGEFNYKDGKRVGKYREYDEKGRLTGDEFYSNGELVGYIHYNGDGSIHGNIT